MPLASRIIRQARRGAHIVVASSVRVCILLSSSLKRNRGKRNLRRISVKSLNQTMSSLSHNTAIAIIMRATGMPPSSRAYAARRARHYSLRFYGIKHSIISIPSALTAGNFAREMCIVI